MTEVTTVRDYRDELRDILDNAFAEKGLTRYRLCRDLGMDSGVLSNVLAKRRNFSIDKMSAVANYLGYDFKLTPKP